MNDWMLAIVAWMQLIISVPLGIVYGNVACKVINYILYRPNIKQKHLELAIEQGHKVYAKLKQCQKENVVGGIFNRNFRGGYEYEWNGQHYLYVDTFQNEPPASLILYFRKNPRKAAPEAKFGGLEAEAKWIKLFFVLIAFAFALIPFISVRLR